MKKIGYFIKTEIWWSITRTFCWWWIALKKSETEMRHPGKDFFNAYSADGKFVYYDDYLTHETYKVKTLKGSLV